MYAVFFLTQSGKIYTWQEIFTQAPPVVPVTKMRYAQSARKPNFTPKKTTKDTKNTKNVSEKVKCMQFFLTQSGKIYTWQEIFTQAPPVVPVTNMRYVGKSYCLSNKSAAFLIYINRQLGNQKTKSTHVPSSSW